MSMTKKFLIAGTLVTAGGLLLGNGENPESPPAEPQPGQEWTNPGDGMVMVWVPGGEFLMGGPPGEGRADERPQHRVHIDGFWMGKYEVTEAQYRTFCGATRRAKPPEPPWEWKDGPPVVQVSWNDAAAYCEWAGLRLPTEAEWEYAARGGKGYEYGTEDGTLNEEMANYWGSGAPKRPEPVGRYPANPFGLHDLAGNVLEWCQDWYSSGYYRVSPTNNPQGPASGTARTLRGGAWVTTPDNVRSSYRASLTPAASNHFTGFRCVLPPTS